MSARKRDKTDYEITDFIAANNPSGVLAFHPYAERRKTDWLASNGSLLSALKNHSPQIASLVIA